MTNEEINKSCAKLMGRPYREYVDHLNNKSDWADLIQFVVNAWEDKECEDFIRSVQQDEPDYNEYSFPRHLLKGTRVLPEALARWKEGE